MITLTIREALATDPGRDARFISPEWQLIHHIYVFRDGDVVLYVGQSQNWAERLEQHLGRSWRGGPSRVGQIVLALQPGSLDWSFDLYSAEEILHGAYRNSVNFAENELIARLRPCLNSSNNEYPSPLPDKYRLWPDDSSGRYLDV